MEFEIIGLDHVQIAIPFGKEDIAREFFVRKLGFFEIPKPENLRKKGGAWFQCGSAQLHVGISQVFSPAEKAHPAFNVRNLDAYRDHLESIGLHPRTEDPLPGANRFYIDDPFGNRLEFLEWINP